jgi:opacity protein-like surface antigen
MMQRKLLAMSIAALGAGFSSFAFSQQTSPPPARDTFTMPYQSGFWGHAGLSVGRAKLHADCPAGAACDLRDNSSWRVFGGGKFNNMFGAEAGLMDLGDFERGGGHTTARGLDLALVAGFPLPVGQNSSIFGKLGTSYIRTNVGGTGLKTGKESGWGPRVGVGVQLGVTQNWAARLDADRYRVEFPGSSKQNIDTYMIGAQYSFR